MLISWTLVKPLTLSPTKLSWLLMAGMAGHPSGEKVAGWSGPEGGKWGWIYLGPSWYSPELILFNVLTHDLDPGWALMILRVFSSPNDSIPLESKGLGKEEYSIPPGPTGWPGAEMLRVGTVHHPLTSLYTTGPL